MELEWSFYGKVVNLVIVVNGFVVVFVDLVMKYFLGVKVKFMCYWVGVFGYFLVFLS